MPLEPVHLHVDATELGDDVLARRQSGDFFLPVRQNFILFAGIGTDSKRAAKVVKDNRCIGKRLCQVGQF